ncbi:hypothetical protein FC84_GL000861 [Lapidilactobacillus dextrinicus DSM 20335]|uniref:Methyl-accepting chemotaxis-like protein n=1 Tax=Lapidilactobacillus dextrinicus DSM 20335 TaxID=1423738 RepID=A0A0R2BHZ5_9LACO|nr:DUF948 domain-containing protein [Lapidilactobacillus dextrinicus]KRM78421.1 hypothetical protein FC84_GL000861 [Lapidilactobacillus dextrinicus DSM 20335]QFG47223.1 DUF948 domain-containing protein [Lapidilactobacillus dextrinicus]
MSGGEIAGLIAAGALLILVIFISIFLMRITKVMKNVEKTVDGVNQSLNTVTKDVDVLSSEVEGLLVKSNTLLDDVNGKVANLDPVFKAMGELGTSVSDLNTSSRNLASKITSPKTARNTMVTRVARAVLRKK